MILNKEENMRRNTNQRQIVFDSIMSLGHVTSEELIQHITSNFDNISLASIYRNLTILLEDKKIKKIKLHDTEVYETIKEKHYHYECVVCKNVIDIQCDKILLNMNSIHDAINENVIDCDMVFYGICNKCAKKQNLERGNKE